MFNKWLSKGCRQFGLIDDISDLVSSRRSDISINPDLVETLSTINKYMSGINIYMIAMTGYVLKSLYTMLGESMYSIV